MFKRAVILVFIVSQFYGSHVRGDEDPIEIGNFLLRPLVSVLQAHDNRVFSEPSAESDVYSETEFQVTIDNLPARYDVSANGVYGHRFYRNNTFLDDDFYTVGAGVGSAESKLEWDVSADLTKSLNYNTGYNPDAESEPDSILSDSPNRRFKAKGEMAYNGKISERLMLIPSYQLLHYYQESEGSGSVEWQIHQTALRLEIQRREKTRIYSKVFYGIQMNDDEDGIVAGMLFGVASAVSEKLSWLAEAGYAHADYDSSGSDGGFSSNVRGSWRLTDKLYTYVFGGNDFHPGYGNTGARWVYRLGYGGVWEATDQLDFKLGLLHDYQEEIGAGESTDPSLDELRSFLDLRAGYHFARHASLSLGYRYVRDEFSPDRQVVSMRLSWAF